MDGREVVVLLHPANASRQPHGLARLSRLRCSALFAELAARAGFPVVEVVAAVVRRGGRYLVTRRAPGKHLAGLWEFPGGKRHPGESLADALRREMAEELGVEARAGERLEAVIPWAYPERRVVLHFFECTIGRPAVTPREGQPARWVTRAELARLPFPPADATLIATLVHDGRKENPS